MKNNFKAITNEPLTAKRVGRYFVYNTAASAGVWAGIILILFGWGTLAEWRKSRKNDAQEK